MLIVSTPNLENQKIKEYLGIVTGSTVRARNVGSDIINFVSLIDKEKDFIIKQNKKDLIYASKKNLKKNLIDRLTLNENKITQIQKSLIEIIKMFNFCSTNGEVRRLVRGRDL